MTEATRIAPLRVVIVGGGIAALEALLALHELAGARLRVTMIAPEPDFILRPMAVAAPFSRGHSDRLPLAQVTAEDVWSMNMDRVEVHVLTPELEPLEIFGAKASAAVAELLDAARITVHRGVCAQIHHSGRIETGAGPQIVTDCVVALPVLEGPGLGGIPSTAHGFIPVDDAGLVDGLDSVYAVGDATDRPIKQGGLACQQADVTAAHIAARAGAGVDVPPLQQVLRGRLLTGTRDRFLRRAPGELEGSATHAPLWWPPAKVSGKYLSPYLVAKGVAALPLRAGHPGPGIDVHVPLTRQQKRVHEDILGLSPLGPIVRYKTGPSRVTPIRPESRTNA